MQKQRPKCLAPATLLAECGDLADTAAGWRRYVEYLGVVAEEDLKKREAEEKYGKMSRGWAIGTGEFKAELQKLLMAQAKTGERFDLLGKDGEACRELRSAIWEEKLAEAAAALGVSLRALGPQKSPKEKVMLAALLKSYPMAGWPPG